MLPSFGFAEFFVVVAVALIVVGPRDLPKLMRQLGGMARKARGMAEEFQRSFDEIGREAELDELRREIQEIKRLNPMNELRRPFEDARREMMSGPTPSGKPGAEEKPSAAKPPAPSEAEPAPAAPATPDPTSKTSA